MKDLLSILGRVGVAGGTIFGIGLAIVSQDPQAPVGEVPAAQADIVDAAVKDGTEFTRAMAALGLRPRSYDFNGNVMYFASGYADGKNPYETMDVVQEELVNFGVNSRNWLGEKPVAQELAESGQFQQIFDPANGYNEAKLEALDGSGVAGAMLKGEVVPLQKERDYIVMGAVTPNRDAGEVYKDYVNDKSKSPIRDHMGGYRFIDATNESKEDRSMVTAVWTDENFDSKKMDNRAFKQQEGDPNVPACVGCEREFRMQSLQKDEPFRQNKWTARNAGLDDTYDFYKRAMATRGWQESDVQRKLNLLGQYFPEVNDIPGRTLNFEKDGRTMTVTLLPAPNGGTEVYSSEQYEDTQSPLRPGAP